ncbi:MAG: hypothetical protein U9R08_05780 [Nanoarchaeota archaeon]|nr:hypothetical protein [Nanoarchaeota archaeon]
MPNGIDIKDYVKKALRQGNSERQVRDYLTKRKYPKHMINKAFNDLKNKGFSKSKPIIKNLNNNKKNIMPSSAKKIELYAGIIVVALIIVIVLITSSGVKNCIDDACFIQEAQKCGKATLFKDEVGSSIKYEIKSECVLEKSISEFADDEPVEIINLFGNKVMTCPYIEQGFNVELIDSVVSGIDSCNGELKDAIFELKLAQYELLLE